MMKSILSLLILFTLATPLAAAQVVPEDFAFGMDLTIEEPGTVYKISLPKDVYLNMDRKDFGDIRVFNKNNEPVPHSLKQPENIRESSFPPALLPFFPVFRSQIKNGNMLSLNINTDKAGAIINIQTDDKTATDKIISYYLIDLTHLEQIPDALLFKWSENNNNFSIKTTLESSDNLTDWTPVISDTTLASLDFSGHSLVKDKISLSPKKIKYLRMSWPMQAETREIVEVQALFPSREKTFPHEWHALLPESINKKLHTFEYKITGAFPVSLVNIELQGENRIFNALIESRPDEKSPWLQRHRGLFFRIDTNGVLFSNDAIAVGRTSDSYWRLTFDPETPGPGNAAPQLEFGWIPHELYFISQGEGPYRMAFGNLDIKPAENLVDQLLLNLDKTQRLEIVKTALPSPSFKLGEKKAAKTSFQWQKWTLWAILILSVLLLGWMAVRLLKQMNASGR
ncbi:MAG: DUF3999 domain-containing protein [Desulfobacula sp.]|jgi:hypothetical protein